MLDNTLSAILSELYRLTIENRRLNDALVVAQTELAERDGTATEAD